MRSVRRSADWDRICALPVRQPVDIARESARLQEQFGTANPMPLREVQTLALVALEQEQGGFFPIQVGGGKTLVTLMAPQVLKAQRPVLLLPASLREKTQRELHKYEKHWRVALHLRLISYEELGRVNMAKELEEWAQALDLGADPMARMGPGPLGDDKDDARRKFRDRLRSHPGIVIHESEDTNASLRVQALEYQVNEKTEQAFKKLRAEWATPTGFTFIEAVMLWKFARELALGHWVEWDPHAPDEWLFARKDWASLVRETLSRSRKYDSELQVRNAVRDHEIEGSETLAAWEAVRDTFTPNPKDTWQDDGALEACAGWAGSDPGIIFTGHSFFGRTLARRLGAPYYGAEGKNDQGEPIESEDGTRLIVASIQANGTGRNLQQFSRALVTASLNDLEQLLGRLHRQGQDADEVEFTFLVGCWEHVDGFWKACESAQGLTDLTGGKFKLTFADITFPTREDVSSRPGARWKKQG